jgi:hypothetical protein
MVDRRMAFDKSVEFAFGFALNLLQQFFRREHLPSVQGVQHLLAVRKEQRVSHIEKKRFNRHASSLLKPET